MQTFPIIKKYIQGPDFITLDQENLTEQLEFARVNSIYGFNIIHDPTKQPFPNLDFLLNMKVRGLVIYFDAVTDTSSINKFHDLEVLQFGYMRYPTSDIDLSNFEKLRVFDAYWNKHVKHLETLSNLIRLNIWGYKPKARNLEALRNCNNLVYLKLVQPGLDNLDGIENLLRLREADFGNIRSLKSFYSEEKEFTAPLEELTFSLCPNFDIDTIPIITTLKRLGLSQIGKRQTLKNLLEKLPNVESLGYTQSELVDGNLNYFLGHPMLRKIFIDHKKHYNLKEKDIQKRLDANKAVSS